MGIFIRNHQLVATAGTDGVLLATNPYEWMDEARCLRVIACGARALEATAQALNEVVTGGADVSLSVLSAAVFAGGHGALFGGQQGGTTGVQGCSTHQAAAASVILRASVQATQQPEPEASDSELLNLRRVEEPHVYAVANAAYCSLLRVRSFAPTMCRH